MIFDECMDGLAEDGGTADAGNLARQTERARDFRRGDFNAQCALRLNVGELAERIGRAVGNQLAVINVGYVAAALGFVHVVSGDEEGDAMTGKLEEEIPELAARDRVDAGGGLVEEKKGRLVQHGAAEGEALLPATGKLRGQTSQIGCQAVELNNFFDAALQARGLQAVDAAVKLQVFRHRQIVVEAEVLRHVADALADGFRICADVHAFAMGSISRFQLHVGSHAGKHLAARIMDANLYAKNLVHAFLAGLHVAWQEFSLLIDLFEDPFENSFWKRVDSDFGPLAELEAAILGFGNVDANVDLIFL